MMVKSTFPLVMGAAVLALSGCLGGEGLKQYNGNPNSIIATNQDRGDDAVSIIDGHAAIVYDPDGCQGWMIDDGVEATPDAGSIRRPACRFVTRNSRRELWLVNISPTARVCATMFRTTVDNLREYTCGT